MNKPGANGRVSYDSLTHSRLQCRDGRKRRSLINECDTDTLALPLSVCDKLQLVIVVITVTR